MTIGFRMDVSAWPTAIIDLEVDIDDMLDVIEAWGMTGTPGNIGLGDTNADNNWDGVVDIDDLLRVFNQWGSC